MHKKQAAFFFKNFIRCAEYACQASRLLDEIITNFDKSKLTHYLSQMHITEQAADIKKHALTEAAGRSFVTPIDREDIVIISQSINELTGKVEDVLKAIYCGGVTRIRPDAYPFVQIIIKSCEEVREMFRKFENYKHYNNLNKHIININSFEKEADKLYLKSIASLQKSRGDLVDIITWRDIYTRLKGCADAAETIADITEIVAIKNT